MFDVACYLRDVDQQGAHCRRPSHVFSSIQHLYSATSNLVLGRGGPKQR